MAISAAAIFLIGASVAAAGTAYTVRQQNMTNKRMATIQGQQADAQGKQLALQAQAEKTQGEVEELNRQQTLQRILSAQNAVFGATGLASTSGSFTNIQTADAGRAADATRLNQLFEDTRQVGFKSSINNLHNQAAISRSAAKVNRRTNTVRGATSILNIGTSYYTNKGK